MLEKFVKTARFIIKLIILLLIAFLILSLFRNCNLTSCSCDLKFPFDFNFPFIDLFPEIGFIDVAGKNPNAPSDKGDNIPDNPDGDNPSDEYTDLEKHKCVGEIITVSNRPTCVETGLETYYECSECHELFNSKGMICTYEELEILPIDPDAHSSNSKFISNGDETHTAYCVYDNSHEKFTEDCEYSEIWIYDAEEHYHICACGDKKDTEEHFDDDNDAVCDVCGFEFSAGEGDAGGGGGDEPKPEIPENPECEHRDVNGDGFCDNCNEEFSDGDGDEGGEGGDKPKPDIPENPVCEHLDANDDGFCDKCNGEFSDGDDSGSSGTDYTNLPGGSMSNISLPGYKTEQSEYTGGDAIPLTYDEIELDILLNVGAFYSQDFTVTQENPSELFVTPIKITSVVSIFKIRISFNEGFEHLINAIATENYSYVESNEEEGWIEFYYDLSVPCEEDLILGLNGQRFTKNEIKAIEVFNYDDYDN